MRHGTPKLGSALRTLDLLEGIILDQGRSPAHEIGRQLQLKRATVYRMVRTLEESGQLQRSWRGHYVAGVRLRRLLAAVDRDRVHAELARPLIRNLARMTGHTAHLGVLNQDMTTYLVKEGSTAGDVFTRENIQLESYCSGIGKVLLAHLPKDEQERYLSGGPFVPLTPNTIVDPDQLRHHLQKVRSLGYAIDDREVAPNLLCMAVPVLQADEAVTLALSVSGIDHEKFEKSQGTLLRKLEQTAEQIALRLSN